MAVLRVLQFVFRAQPIVEIASRFTPSFLEQFIGATSDDLRLDESDDVCLGRVRVSRMFSVLPVYGHGASSLVTGRRRPE
jgi:hypothetical protein